MSLVQTKKIKAPFKDGFALINADDFDPAQHELFEPEAKAPKQPKTPKAE